MRLAPQSLLITQSTSVRELQPEAQIKDGR
jgi:hypothetical protein